VAENHLSKKKNERKEKERIIRIDGKSALRKRAFSVFDILSKGGTSPRGTREKEKKRSSQ